MKLHFEPGWTEEEKRTFRNALLAVGFLGCIFLIGCVGQIWLAFIIGAPLDFTGFLLIFVPLVGVVSCVVGFLQLLRIRRSHYSRK